MCSGIQRRLKQFHLSFLRLGIPLNPLTTRNLALRKSTYIRISSCSDEIQGSLHSGRKSAASGRDDRGLFTPVREPGVSLSAVGGYETGTCSSAIFCVFFGFL